MESTPSKRVLAAIPDLFFGSKVAGAAKRIGIEVQFASTREALLDGVKSSPDLVIVDLDAGVLDPLGAIREIRGANLATTPRLVAFASHVHGSLLAGARAAGCDQVLTRGALASGLPGLLKSV